MVDRGRLVLVLLLVTSVVAIAKPKAAVDRRTLGGMTFVLPAGWKLDQPPGQDHATLTYADSKRYCIISLYQPIASDNIEIDFVREWQAVAGAMKDTTPKPTRRKVNGRDVIEATGSTPANDGTMLYERVSVMGGSGQMTAEVVLTANAATSRDCNPASDAFYASVEFAAAATPSVQATDQPVPPATSGAAGTLKPSIAAADLVGSWSYGATAGSFRSFANMSYTFRANGSYEYTESGLSNGSRFKDTYSGRFTWSGGNLVLTPQNGVAKTLQIVAFMNMADGSAVLTTYAEYQTGGPLDAAAIAKQCAVQDGLFQCEGGALWTRAAPKKK